MTPQVVSLTPLTNEGIQPQLKDFDCNDDIHKKKMYSITNTDHFSQLEWFKSYLSNRSQFTRVNGIDSEVENINIGVPQGSCLGPLLFLIYINDLPKFVRNASVYTYADDTS